MQLTRRNLLATAAPVAVLAAAGGLAACSTTTNSSGQTVVSISPTVLSFIQNAVATATAIIPSAVSIANVIAGLDPAIGAVVSIGEAVVSEAISFITNAIQSLPPAASSRLRATAPGVDVPVAVAKLPNGKTVQITGTRV